MKERIGILGYGGKMGSALCSILPGGMALKLGQRSLTGLERENVRYQQADICQEESMRAFTEGISLLINCAGPSMQLPDLAAKAAAARGIPYVDAFGGQVLADSLKKSGVKGRFVLNAGSFPGLTGILPVGLAERFFDQVDSFSLEVTNHENWGKASALDLVFSALNRYGKAGHYYSQGEILPCPSSQDAAPEGDLVRLEYMNQETAAVAELLGARQAHFIQLREGKEQEEELLRTVQQYMTGRDQALLEQALARQMEKTVEKEYFRIRCSMKGRAQGQEKEVVQELLFPNSYLAGAAVIAHCARQLLKQPEAAWGIKSAYEVADPSLLIRRCVELGAEQDLQVGPDEEVEEGEL